MRPLFITAASLVSAMGQGLEATLGSLFAARSGLRPCDFEDVANGGYIGRVEGLESRQLDPAWARFDCRNNRLADLTLRIDGFDHAVARACEIYGPERIGVVLGTSTSGIHAGEQAYRARDPASGALPEDFDFVHTQDLFSLAKFVRQALTLRGPALVISNACASSAMSFIEASLLIEAGICDAVVAGGVDSLCQMTLLGFASLDLIAPGPCRPCDAERNGISIGEAGGFVLLEREGSSLALLGYGVTSDGYHMSAPHPEGAGAAAAMHQALARAGLDAAQIDYVNLHGTGTRANDAAEDRAVAQVLGPAIPCSSTKGWSGHALGAAGILEALVSMLCICNGLLPGCLNLRERDPAFRCCVLERNVMAPVRRVVSNSFGFGGSNCSLVFGRV
ncbi:MAG: beta-ketoacyl-[acyl-carrier-protein] synthase family protein [Acetobacteraceae bacterium]|nr:beta-ketoacyl-[acyl-carrier-protein] synthase family protein [Acetobacteraceae bacterium]MBV8526325.1 beta-ketoacyl-[acyl-carrier-protein] synthase family protein [Acetobacteraceae bacterium]